MQNNFIDTIDFWISELHRYDAIQLRIQPSENSWSIGQVYMHLVENTCWFLEQVKRCATTNDHESADASPEAKKMFDENSFPDELLEGPPENATTPQPVSKETLLNDLFRLKEEILAAQYLILNTRFKGKTKHPGLHYFSAAEWFKFAEMHFRHHIRQKKRIDAFLNIDRKGREAE